MAANALFLALWANQHTALLAVGAPRLTAYFALVRLAVFVPSFIALTPAHGAIGVAGSALAASLVAYALGLGWSLKRLSIGLNEYLRELWRPLFASILMVGAVREVNAVIAQGHSVGSSLLRLAAGIGAGMIVYALALALLYLAAGRPNGAEKLLLQRVRHLRKR
jgi:hypothetical protein